MCGELLILGKSVIRHTQAIAWLDGEVAQGFFTAVVDQARARGPLSDEHFYGRRYAHRGLGRTQGNEAADGHVSDPAAACYPANRDSVVWRGQMGLVMAHRCESMV
jgi:hypothetical protein